MNGQELECFNAKISCNKEADKHKENLSVNDNKGEEKTLSTSENKEKARDGYVRIYECGKKFCNSTSECAFVAQEKPSVR